MVITSCKMFWRAETEDSESQVAVNCLCRGCRTTQDVSGCSMGYIFAWERGDRGRQLLYFSSSKQ